MIEDRLSLEDLLLATLEAVSRFRERCSRVPPASVPRVRRGSSSAGGGSRQWRI